jgi:hypothetical protein
VVKTRNFKPFLYLAIFTTSFLKNIVPPFSPCLRGDCQFIQRLYFIYISAQPRYRAVNLTKTLQFTKFLADFINTMWCQQCQQDVPAIASSGDRKFCCPRCGQAVGGQSPSGTDAKTSSSDPPLESACAAEIPSFDCWEFDDQLWHIAQALQVDTAPGHRREKGNAREVFRYDQAHDALNPRHAPPTPVSRERKSEIHSGSIAGSLLAMLIWAALYLGTAALVCGGILLGWSLWTGRGELWKIGLPIAAGGQISLLIGLLLQIDRFWHDNHRTVVKLDEVDEELHDLKTTANLLRTVHGPSSPQFYTHQAGNANPHVLLSDLKAQLDSLALKIGDRE